MTGIGPYGMRMTMATSAMAKRTAEWPFTAPTPEFVAILDWNGGE